MAKVVAFSSLRAEPKRDAAEIMEIGPPDRATVHGQSGEWSEVTIQRGQRRGFVLSEVLDLNPEPGGGSEDTIERSGFVIRVRRSHVERRSGAIRTVGRYEVFFDTQKVSEHAGQPLEGMTLEPLGPGDNSEAENGKRIEAKTYPLYTHRSSNGKYDTHGYTSSNETGAWARPGVRLAGTNQRSGILFHPSADFLWSIGCINLTPDLRAQEMVNYKQSRSRVVGMINAMAGLLGDRFPADHHVKIQDAVMVVEGEPEFERSRSLVAWRTTLARRAARDVLEPMARTVAIEGTDGITQHPFEIYEAFAITMSAVDRATPVHLQGFLLLLAQADPRVRDQQGETLWPEWARGWHTTQGGPDAGAQRNDHLEIAKRLRERGVDVNDNAGLRTPLTAIAASNRWRALQPLQEWGADVNLRDRRGYTPLLAGAFHGSVEAVEHLLTHGADRSARMGAPDAAWVAGSEQARQLAEGDAEVCPAGANAIECAAAGKLLSTGEASRNARFERIITALNNR